VKWLAVWNRVPANPSGQRKVRRAIRRINGSIAATFGMVGGVAFEIRSSDLTPKTRLLQAVPRAVRAMLCGDK